MKPLQEKMAASMSDNLPPEMSAGMRGGNPPSDETTHGGPNIEEVD